MLRSENDRTSLSPHRTPSFDLGITLKRQEVSNEQRRWPVDLPHSTVAPEQAFDQERQDWYHPMPSSEFYAGPDELLQPKYRTEPLEDLNAARDFDTPQTATPSRGKAKKRNCVDSDTASNWRDESDPVKRRRLANIFHARQSESKQRAEADARNRAFMGGSETNNRLET
jgi:hypothetical protein